MQKKVILFLFLLLIFGLFSYRFYDLRFKNNTYYLKEYSKVSTKYVYDIKEERGRILDNKGRVLVDNKKNNDSVKNAIEDQVENAKAIIKIEDSSSYSTYQGEIDEGKAYVVSEKIAEEDMDTVKNAIDYCPTSAIYFESEK